MDGGIDNSKIMFLNNAVSRSDPEVRKSSWKEIRRFFIMGILWHISRLGEKMRKQECVIKVPGLNEKFRFKVPDHMSIAEVISLLAVLIKEEYPEAEIQAESMELYQARTGKSRQNPMSCGIGNIRARRMDSSIGGQMTSNIRLNYEKVMREAARLDGEENVFEEQIKKICGVAERLRHEWESPASAVCIQKIEQIAEEMTETRKKCSKLLS